MQTTSSQKMEAIYSDLRREILSGKWKVGEKLPTNSELAERFGCSAGTVNKAVALLAHDGSVERRTRTGTRIIGVDAETADAKAKPGALAFIYPTQRHEGIWRVLKGFQQMAMDGDCRVVALATGTDYSREIEYIRRLSEFDVRGAVLYPVLSSMEEAVGVLRMILASKFPIVLAGIHLAGTPFPTVSFDGFHVGYTMTRHLLDRGLRRIGFFTNDAEVLVRRDTYRGYQWALEEAGVTETRGWVLREPSMHPDFEHPLREPTALARRYLPAAEGIEGVVCPDLYLARSLMAAASELGKEIPRDLKIVVGDDFGLAESSRPPLTSYQVCPEQVGRVVYKTLTDYLQDPAQTETEVRVRGELVVRQTS
jgi:GntR family transcriptional regulator of arabinose operon